MATLLVYNLILRKEEDTATINTLIRKGWSVTSVPSYDSDTQLPPRWETGVGWIIDTKPPRPTYRISKATLIERIQAANKLSALITAVNTFTPTQRFLFDNLTWFRSDTAMFRNLCEALSLDPKVILDRDPNIGG